MNDLYAKLGIHATGKMAAALSPAEKRIEKQLSEMEERVRADVAPFGDMSPDGQKRRYAESADPDAFARTYAPHYCTAPVDAFHRDVDALVAGWTPDGHPDDEAFVHVIHGPREHAKSVRARIGLLRRVLRGELHYPLVISEHLYLAQAHVDYLLIELTANARVSADYDVDVLLRDRSDGILRLAVTPRATGVRRLVQIDAASYGRPVKGRVFIQNRPDFALIDDFEATRSAKNDTISKEKRNWVLQEVYPACVGPIVWFGNVGHDTSALYFAICHAEGGEEEGKRLMRVGTRPGLIAERAGTLVGSPVGLPPAESTEAPESPSDGSERPCDFSDGYAPLLPPRTAANGPEPLEGDEDDGDLFAGGAEDAGDQVEAAIAAYVYKAERLVVTPGGVLRTEYLWASRYKPSWYARKKRTMGPFLYEGEFNGNPSREGDFFKREWLEAALYDEHELIEASQSASWNAFSLVRPSLRRERQRLRQSHRRRRIERARGLRDRRVPAQRRVRVDGAPRVADHVRPARQSRPQRRRVRKRLRPGRPPGRRHPAVRGRLRPPARFGRLQPARVQGSAHRVDAAARQQLPAALSAQALARHGAPVQPSARLPVRQRRWPRRARVRAGPPEARSRSPAPIHVALEQAHPPNLAHPPTLIPTR